ncbi:hypothetical protein FJZ31_32445 [Candidatus Poribacteria bacterium]|nr:hypothetical protein [Candidatus Poribacteria bacterium]
MSKAIVITAGQSEFLVETDVSVEVPTQLESRFTPPAAGVSEGMTPVVDLKAVGRKFAAVNELIIGCCNELSDAISKIKPQRFAVEFGIKFAGEAGVPMLGKAASEANIKVSIEWKTNE